jgi:hypothetical protein
MSKIFYLLKQNNIKNSPVMGKWFAKAKSVETLVTGGGVSKRRVTGDRDMAPKCHVPVPCHPTYRSPVTYFFGGNVAVFKKIAYICNDKTI